VVTPEDGKVVGMVGNAEIMQGFTKALTNGNPSASIEEWVSMCVFVQCASARKSTD
jgi:hypothetical protein